jgi:apolipoprotein N-acyltransferase
VRLLERFHIAVLHVLVATARLSPHQWGATRRRQARGSADRRRNLLYPVIPVSLETYGFLSLTIFFITSMIWLGLILLLQYFILNRLISIFTYVRFLYALFFMVIFYLRINLKLKLLFIPSHQRKAFFRNFCILDF